MTWDLSCRDWWKRLQSGRSLVPALPLSPDGDRAVRIFNKLRLADVPGTPTMEEAGADWFRDIVRVMFGCVDSATRARMIRELFALVPKKNSKTTDGALLMLTALLMNERPRAGFIMTAPVQDVTEIAFDAAAGAIDLDPVLAKTFHVRYHLKKIVHRESKAELEIMTFDPAVLTGQKVSGGALIDELHVCAKMAKAPKALRQLRGGMLPFPEAFLAFITTQSDEPPVGVFAEELQKARDIRDGKRKGAMLPVLYEFPSEIQKGENGEWQNTKLWPLITPNIGKSITLDRLEADFQEAKDTSENELRIWASQHLNIEIGLALMSKSWAGATFWPGCAEKTLTLDELLDRSDVAVVGIDGGGLDDLLGAVVIGRDRVTREWLHWAHAWAHQIVLKRRKEVAEHLRKFERQGDLTFVGSPGEDVAQLADVVCRVKDAGLLPEKQAIGVDAAGIGDIVDELTSPERGIVLDQIVAISQGWRLNAAIKTTERKLAGGEMKHGGTGLMAWCVGNARVEPKGNAVSITKQAAGTAKIDPLMATFDAVSLMALNPEGRGDMDGFFAQPAVVQRA